MSSGIPGQYYIPFNDSNPFNPDVPPNGQKMRQVKLSYYSKPAYEFCKKYMEVHTFKHPWDQSDSAFDSSLNGNKLDDKLFIISMSLFDWSNYMVAEKYIEKHKKQYEADKSGGRRRISKKRPAARRGRSSKARKARKARNSRATRRR